MKGMLTQKVKEVQDKVVTINRKDNIKRKKEEEEDTRKEEITKKVDTQKSNTMMNFWKMRKKLRME